MLQQRVITPHRITTMTVPTNIPKTDNDSANTNVETGYLLVYTLEWHCIFQLSMNAAIRVDYDKCCNYYRRRFKLKTAKNSRPQ